MMEGDQRMVSTTQRKKKMSKNSRRFNDEQIKSMETIFKVEAKLEPRKKLQMAGELGLQPRQVAIWFQNKRARWKSKQIEQEYTSLKADYDELDSRFESLKKEKHSSLIQLQKLRDQLNTDGEGVRESKKVVLEGKSTDSCSENGDMKIQVKGKSSSVSGGVDEDMLMYSDEELDRRMNGYDTAEREGDEFQRLGAEKAGGFSELRAERIRGFDELDDGLFNQPCATPTWWDFWS